MVISSINSAKFTVSLLKEKQATDTSNLAKKKRKSEKNL